MCHIPAFCGLIKSCLFTRTSCQKSRHFHFALMQCLPIWKGLQHFFHQGDNIALLQCNSTKHPCKLDILWSYSLLHRVMLQMPLHTQKTKIFKGSHNLIIKRVCRYYCCTRKLMLCKNWSSHSIPAMQYMLEYILIENTLS